MVGANGFEPSTSWSRTRHLNPINALFGVAYGTRNVISPLSVVPNLYLEFGVNPGGKRGFLCSLASLLSRGNSNRIVEYGHFCGLPFTKHYQTLSVFARNRIAVYIAPQS